MQTDERTPATHPAEERGAREVQVRRNAALQGLVGVLASAMAIAYLWRATQYAAPLDWVLCVILGLVGVLQLAALVDARTPLLVADPLGVRIRLGREWRGLPWSSLEQVVVEQRDSWLRDGRVVLSPRNLPHALDGLDGRARRQVALLQKMYGAPLAVPLGLTTRTGTPDLLGDLRELADGRTEVIALGGETRARVEPRVDAATETTAAAPVVAGPEVAHDEEEERAPRRRWWNRRAGVEEEPPEAVRLLVTDHEERADLPTPAEDADDVEDPEDVDDRDDRDDRARGLWARGGLGTLVSRLGHGRYLDVDAPGPTSAAPLSPAATTAPAAPAGPAREPVQAPAAAAYESVTPLRETRRALRAEITTDTPTIGNAALRPALVDPLDRQGRGQLPEAAALRRAPEEEQPFSSLNVRPLATVGTRVEPLVIDDFVTEPALEPVIGPEIRAARTRVGLSVDELSERTRIRPHVLESIEVDDFTPCGGDFYARGHLRTLARTLGLDGAEMVGLFDDRYAHAPINARRVFEAELATGLGGGLRAVSSGPRWSLLVGAVLSLVLVWGVAQLFTAPVPEIDAPSPTISEQAGLAASREPITSPLTTTRTMTVTAARSAARVVVRDRSGRIIWSGRLARGQKQQLAGVGPFRVTASNAAAVDVRVMGRELGSVGTAPTSGRKSFG